MTTRTTLALAAATVAGALTLACQGARMASDTEPAGELALVASGARAGALGFAPMVVVPLPRQDGAEPAREVSAFTGRGVDVRDVLLALFEDSDLNLLIDDRVGGTSTFDVKSTTAEKAFEALLRHFDLAYEFDDDFIVVRPTEHRTFEVDLIDTQSMQAMGTSGSSSTSSGGAGGNGNANGLWERVEEDLTQLLGDGGAAIVNSTAGTVEIDAPPSYVARVERYLATLQERAQRQVSLEARILEVRLTDEFRLGVNWQVLGDFLGSDLTGTLTGGAVATQTAASAATVFNFGVLDADKWSLFVDALENQGQVRVLSSPRVSTLNNVAATIRVVEQVPVIDREIIDSQGGLRTQFDVRFVESGFTVTVLPQISGAGEITAWVNPSFVEQVGTIVTPDGLQTEPILATRETSTMVRVHDGQAVVIGGLRTHSKDEQLQGVPLLGGIPLLGALFRSNVQRRGETELVFLLVPRVLDDAWIEEEVRRSADRLEDLRRPYKASTLRMDVAGEDYRHGLLSGPLEGGGPVEAARSTDRPARRDALAAADRTITRDGLARELCAGARSELGRGQTLQALRTLEQVVALDPGNAEGVLLLAAHDLAAARPERAGERVERLLDARGEEATTLAIRGLAALEGGRPHAAIPYLRKAHELDPGAISATNLAAALIATDRLDEARSVLVTGDLERAWCPEGHVNLAWLHYAAGELDRGDAEVERALEKGVAPEDPRLHAVRRLRRLTVELFEHQADPSADAAPAGEPTASTTEPKETGATT